MIKPVYYVTYNDSFGYAETLEEAKELERTFQYRYHNEVFTASSNTCKQSNIISNEKDYRLHQ